VRAPTGSLSLGDIAVWIAVSAGHRAAAFEACRFLIDEMKARLPDLEAGALRRGSTEWVNCATRGPAPAKKEIGAKIGGAGFFLQLDTTGRHCYVQQTSR